MQQTQWTTSQIKQCEKTIGQAMLSDEHSLVFYANDYGKIKSSTPSAACIPKDVKTLQSLLAFANEHGHPITIRGNGLSQGGQSQPTDGGLSIHMQHFEKVEAFDDEQCIWVEANATFADILATTLAKNKAPYVIPYNCALSVAGVISAGGMGAASFRYGNVAANVRALEVITVSGERKTVDHQDELFHACLGGQGQFAVIHRVCLNLRACKSNARTFSLLYLNREEWFDDLKLATQIADGIEAFCTPAMIGTKQRVPFAQWFYALHVTIEYDHIPPKSCGLKPWKLVHQQDEPIHGYFHRHDSRFAAMKLSGQWDLHHPWYECFIQQQVLTDNLENLLNLLPLHFANMLHVVPVASKAACGFFMLPDCEMTFEVMVLNPGVHPALLKDCLNVIATLDDTLLPLGGKRYLSGYLGKNLDEAYWKRHFADKYPDWQRLKTKFDPQGLLSSQLYLR